MKIVDLCMWLLVSCLQRCTENDIIRIPSMWMGEWDDCCFCCARVRCCVLCCYDCLVSFWRIPLLFTGPYRTHRFMVMKTSGIVMKIVDLCMWLLVSCLQRCTENDAIRLLFGVRRERFFFMRKLFFVKFPIKIISKFESW